MELEYQLWAAKQEQTAEIARINRARDANRGDRLRDRRDAAPPALAATTDPHPRANVTASRRTA